MRRALWNFVCSGLKEGVLLPWWALLVRAILFPLDFFYWRMSRCSGHQWETDTWIIGGARYPERSLRKIASSSGDAFLIVRKGDLVTFEKVSDG